MPSEFHVYSSKEIFSGGAKGELFDA